MRATVVRQLAVLNEGRFVDARTATVDAWVVTYSRASGTFSLITVQVERLYDGTFGQTVRVVSAEDTGVFLTLSRRNVLDAASLALMAICILLSVQPVSSAAKLSITHPVRISTLATSHVCSMCPQSLSHAIAFRRDPTG